MASQCIACPSCQKQIKPATLPALGTRVLCPFCKTPFTVEQMLIVDLPSQQFSPQQTPTAPTQHYQSPATQNSASQIPVAQMATVAPHVSSAPAQRGVPVWAWAVGAGTAAAVLILIGVVAASFFMAPASAPQTVASNTPPQATPAQPAAIVAPPPAANPTTSAPTVQPAAQSAAPVQPAQSTPATPTEPGKEQPPASDEKSNSPNPSTPAPSDEPTVVAKAEPMSNDPQPKPEPKEKVVPLFEKNEEAFADPNAAPPANENPEPAGNEKPNPDAAKADAPEAKDVAKPNNAPVAKPKYNYFLKNQFNYDYQFEFSLAGDGGRIEPSKGSVTYSRTRNRDVLKAQPSLTEEAFKPGPSSGSATAFIVNPDGWLITCAHCVRNIEKIELPIGARTYVAKVIQVDDTHDLALIKIDAKNLTAIPLVTRDVAQGEDANVAGYPLGDVLGNSMKMTYGRIAGFVNEKGERWLQLDTSINPGNSGGPVLGSRGEVLGVVSGALMGDRIDRVGLAAEVGPVRELMKNNKVAGSGVPSAEPLSGTDLAKRVMKSVVQLTLGMRAKPTDDRMLVDYFGTPSLSDPNNMAGGTIGMTTKGEFMSQRGGSDSSFFSTSLGMMAFEELPPDGQKQWQNVRQRSISYTSDIPRSNSAMNPGMGPGMSSRYYRNPYATMQPFQNVVLGQVVIDDTVNYEITKTDGTMITVKTKTKSVWSSPSRKDIGQSEGTGEYKFDSKQGVTTFGKSEFKLKLFRENGIETTIPMRLVYRLEEIFSDQQRKDRVAAREKESKQRRAGHDKDRKDKYANAIKTVKNPKSSDEAAADALSEIQHSPDFSTKVSEAEKKDVSPHLNRWLESQNDSVRSNALRAVERFATEANIATLVKLLEVTEGYQQGYVIEALGATGGNDKVAKMIAAIYASSNHDSHSREALEKMPKFAEVHVLPLLETVNDSRKREEIYDILGKVGGRKSYDALRKILGKREKDDFRDYQLKNAIQDIGKRLAIKGG